MSKIKSITKYHLDDIVSQLESDKILGNLIGLLIFKLLKRSTEVLKICLSQVNFYILRGLYFSVWY